MIKLTVYVFYMLIRLDTLGGSPSARDYLTKMVS